MDTAGQHMFDILGSINEMHQDRTETKSNDVSMFLHRSSQETDRVILEIFQRQPNKIFPLGPGRSPGCIIHDCHVLGQTG